MPAPSTLHNQPEYSVTEISNALKRVVEGQFGMVRVRGEISGLKRPASGHVYLDLKDEKSVLKSICWKGVSGRFNFKPEDGLEVICTGKLTTYSAQSNYQLIIEQMEIAGEGALMALLEKRKQALAAEGLFDAARKKPLPFMPATIGVVTSPTGAVIRDILHRLSDRFPCHVMVWPVRVQGEGAAEEIAAAIRGFNTLNSPPDVIIVARGGGSIEDLWCFNEEVVVRAVADSIIPIISAVGHETDTTLIDYVSDHRAPTPTAAAEMAVPVRTEWLATLDDWQHRMKQQVWRMFEFKSQHIQSLARGLPIPSQLLAFATQTLDGWSDRLTNALPACVMQHQQRLERLASILKPHIIQRRLDAHHEKISLLNQRLMPLIARLLRDKKTALEFQEKLFESLNYRSVLKRGFALIREPSGKPVMSLGQMQTTPAFEIVLHDGSAHATLSVSPKTIRKKPDSTSGQDSLF